MTNYYIIEDAEKTGPFDLMAMMKKIRTDRISPTTLVYVDDAETPVEANSLPELREFFTSSADDVVPTFTAEPDASPLDLIASLREAWTFFSRHQSIIIVSAIFGLGITVVSLLLSAILPAFLNAIITSALAGAGYFFFLLYTLRVVRTHELGIDTLADLFRNEGKPVALAGAVAMGLTLGVPAVIGALVTSLAYIFIIPGFIAFGLFAMTPFFMKDNPDLDFKSGLKTSLNWTRAQGMDNLGVIVALMFINMIAAMVFFFPMLVSLPVTAIALADIYERRVLKAW